VEAGQAEADRLLHQGVQEFQTGQFREALQSWEQALQIYREINNRQGEANTLAVLGIVYQDIGNPQKSLDNLKEAG
jgi:tetratricopeptide (TPR) repeat protein